MTDEQGDPDRTPAEDGTQGTPGSDDGGQTRLGRTRGNPTWTQGGDSNAESTADSEPEMSPAVLK